MFPYNYFYMYLTKRAWIPLALFVVNLALYFYPLHSSKYEETDFIIDPAMAGYDSC